MARNPLTRLLQKAFADTVRNRQSPALHSGREAAAITSSGRREFLKKSTFAAAGLLLPPLLPPFHLSPFSSQNLAANPFSVAIIGAGMAGLQAAYQLQKRQIPAIVYEASDRVGGRMFTLKDQFGPGITTDIGGEFVDTTHADILQLATELGLELYDLKKDSLLPKTFHFEGRLLGEKDLRDALSPYTDRLLKDIHSLPPVISHASADSFRTLDQLSILEYLREIGISGWLFHFLDIVLTREYGMESAQQSAINFLIMFAPPTAAERDYELFGQEHEVLKIRGGSQHLCDKLYERVKEQIRLQEKLISLTHQPDDGYSILLEGKGGRRAVHASHVILTLPFTILRTLPLDIPMPEEKRRCIQEIGYGNSCKFILGMNGKPWRKSGSQGYTFTDLSFGCGWDSSQSQSGTQGSFTVLGGGNFAEQVRKQSSVELSHAFLPDLEHIYPGAENAYNWRNKKFCWSEHPYTKAGYSAFKKGQWSTLAGWEGVPVGQVYFAGEHTSREFQGYMNGAAQTGREAAEAIVAQIKTAASSQKISI